MTNPATINTMCISPSLPPNSQADSAIGQSHLTPNLHISVLQFFFAKDLAILERVNRIFREELLPVIEMQMSKRNAISFNELFQLAQLKRRGKLVDSLLPLSDCLNELKEIDYSYWDFDDLNYKLVQTLPFERLQKITSLNFSSSQSLTIEKLQSLFMSSSVFGSSEAEQAQSHSFLFPCLRSLDFADSTFNDSLEDLSASGIFLESNYGELIYAEGNKYAGQFEVGVHHGLRIRI